MYPHQTIRQDSYDRIFVVGANTNVKENGFQNNSNDQDSEKAIQEYMQDPPIKATDDHLVEFAEAMRTVAKALRRAAEAKAAAQAEAAEWKRKYECERANSLRNRPRGQGCDSDLPNSGNGMLDNSCNDSHETTVDSSTIEQSERCCRKHGICSHEILQDESTDSSFKITGRKVARKASFRLSWGCNGKKSGQQKHEVVSFERGDITTAERSSKQILLKWETEPKTVLILTKPNSNTVRVLSVEMVSWLKNHKKIEVFVEPRVRAELLREGSFFEFVKTWENGTGPFVQFVPELVAEASAAASFKAFAFRKKCRVLAEASDKVEEVSFEASTAVMTSGLATTTSRYKDEDIQHLHSMVDLVVTLGGDGTVLWAASLFKGPVPPLVPFSLGSLGFMTPFQSENYRDCLDMILKGPFSITLRHRLQCHVIREAAKDELDAEEPILVLNEVTIDRGISSYLTFLECYCDSSFVTCVQGDGLILSTTSGSTAYSLAAGGSMVHPQVPGILFTPICPHSLSFRPLIFPEYVTLRVQVPFNSRGHAWASFDGKGRKQLAPGDTLVCSMAPWPVPTACQVDSTNDFLRSIHEGLHWNLRKTQSFDGPRDS